MQIGWRFEVGVLWLVSSTNPFDVPFNGLGVILPDEGSMGSVSFWCRTQLESPRRSRMYTVL